MCPKIEWRGGDRNYENEQKQSTLSFEGRRRQLASPGHQLEADSSFIESKRKTIQLQQIRKQN